MKLEGWEGQSCAWCGKPATAMKLVERGITRKKDGVPTVIAASRNVPACDEHSKLPESDEPQVVRTRNAVASKNWKARQEKLV